MQVSSVSLGLSALLLALGAVACATPAEGPAPGSEDAIIGGVAVESRDVDAVGALVLEAGGMQQMFCTATLVTPRHVVTAKHCSQLHPASSPDVMAHAFTELGTVYFAVGHDATAPRKRVRAERVDVTALSVGGGAQIGADVGVYTLAEPLTDVTPMPLSTAPLADGDIGKRFTAIGYGVRDAAGSTGLRMGGTVTFDTKTGSAWKAAYGSFDAFKAFLVSMGAVSASVPDAALMGLYEQPLLDGYEAYFAKRAGDVQSCSGDSGGPLLRDAGDHFEVVGIASWVPQKFPDSALCDRGVVYATFGKSVQALFATTASATAD